MYGKFREVKGFTRIIITCCLITSRLYILVGICYTSMCSNNIRDKMSSSQVQQSVSMPLKNEPYNIHCNARLVKNFTLENDRKRNSYEFIEPLYLW